MAKSVSSSRQFAASYPIDKTRQEFKRKIFLKRSPSAAGAGATATLILSTSTARLWVAGNPRGNIDRDDAKGHDFERTRAEGVVRGDEADGIRLVLSTTIMTQMQTRNWNEKNGQRRLRIFTGANRMKSFTHYLTMNIPSKMAFENITPEVAEAVQKSGVKEGIALINTMHITSSVFVNDDERPAPRFRRVVGEAGAFQS